MHKFYPQKITEYGYGIKVTIVSKRLSDLIIKKSVKKEWRFSYFPLADAVTFEDYNFKATALGAHGLFIAVKNY